MFPLGSSKFTLTMPSLAMERTGKVAGSGVAQFTSDPSDTAVLYFLGSNSDCS